jgi:site-specific recombinase XerD
MDEIIHIPGTLEVLTAIPRSPDQNPAYVYLASLPARSGRLTQKQVLTVMANWLGGTLASVEWGALRYAYTVALKTRVLNSNYSPASARKFMSALRGTLKAAWRLGQIPAEEYAKAVDLGRIGGTSLPAGRFITPEEMKIVFDSCQADKTINGDRDTALFALLYGCGLRREELVNLNIEDYHPNDGTLLVHGKRDKERLAYITNGTQEALEVWLLRRGWDPGPLFLAVSATGRIRPQHRLSPQMVYNTVYKRIKMCGLEKFSPHSLRRSFCSSMLDAGVDIATVSKLAGHSSVQTTQIYDRRPGETQRAGAALLQIPFHKREDARE